MKHLLPITLFCYGFLAGCAGLLLQTLLVVLWGENTPLQDSNLLWLTLAVAIEELMKLGFLLQASRRFPGQISWIAGSLFGLGFAAVEFGLALTSGQSLSLPLLGANALLHVGTTSLFVWGLRHFGFPSFQLLLGSLIAIVTHLVYNLIRLGLPIG